MKIEHFDDIAAWQLAPVCRRTGRREFARKVYRKYKEHKATNRELRT